MAYVIHFKAHVDGEYKEKWAVPYCPKCNEDGILTLYPDDYSVIYCHVCDQHYVPKIDKDENTWHELPEKNDFRVEQAKELLVSSITEMIEHLKKNNPKALPRIKSTRHIL